MILRYLRKTFFGLFLFLMAYLFVVCLWASSAAEELLKETPPDGQVMPLHSRQVEALIKIEDPTFRQHSGLDISTGQGLTTITSVVARDLFLGNQDLDGINGAMQSFYRGVFACCKRIDLGRDVMALILDSRTTKEQQLRMFVTRTYFGSSNGKAVIGFEAAASAYYGKDLSQLTDQEFYGILVMPMAPNRYHPTRHPELHAERARRIEAVVTGKCGASDWLDLTYEACATGN